MYRTLISTDDLAARLSASDLVVVDVRHDLAQPDTWGRNQYHNGHIPGAVFAHLDRDLSAPMTGTNGRHPLPSPEASAATFSRLGIDATTQVVAYDQGSGMYASRLWWMLHWLGHERAAVLDGGYAKWTREGRVVETDAPIPRPSAFSIRKIEPTVDAAAIQASLGQGLSLVMDARSSERYRGDIEPMDRVAGHIPGAVNRPYAGNLNADGTIKAPDVLRAEFEAMLEGRDPARIVHSCGSGVSACHNLLAMEVAGLGGSRLYPGSWSEWCADPARPVARGQ